jgi:hypothetical protein
MPDEDEQQQQQESNEEGEQQEQQQEQKPEALTADSVRAIVADSVRPLHETIGQLRERNTSLEALLRTRDEERRPEPVQSTGPAAPSKEEFLEKMNADPYGTIRGLIEDVANPLVTNASTKTRNEITSEQKQNQALLSAAEQDRLATLDIANEYGEPGSPERDKFDDLANDALKEITGRFGRYIPGHLEQAAARAERKMRAASTNGNGNRGTNVRPFNRNPVRSSTGATGGDAGAGGPPTIAKTIDDLVAQKHLSTDEATEVRHNIKKWNLSEEKYVKNWLEASKENPRYGTGV